MRSFRHDAILTQVAMNRKFVSQNYISHSMNSNGLKYQHENEIYF